MIGPAGAQRRDGNRSRSCQRVEALNKGDIDAFARSYTADTIQIDAFGRTTGINAEFIQALQKKGVVLSIEGIRVLRGGETGLAHGTYTSKYADPNMTPG